FAAIYVDDLLVQQVTGEQQMRLVAVVGDELVVRQNDPVEGDLADLVVSDLEVGFSLPEQVAGNTARVLSRRNGGFPNTPDPGAVGTFQAQAGQFRQIDQPLQADCGRRHLAIERRPNAP